MEICTESEEATYISKLDVNEKSLYAKFVWKDNNTDLFHINILNDSQSWTGKFSNELAVARRERLDESEEEYKRNVFESLTGSCKDFVYDFRQSPDDVNVASFIWKKRYEGAIKVHGVVSLQRDESSISKDTLLDILLEKNKKLFLDIDHVNKANSSLKEDLELYTQKLQELIECKSSLESNLYGRFVQVLNEKKKRIKLLEEHIKNL